MASPPTAADALAAAIAVGTRSDTLEAQLQAISGQIQLLITAGAVGGGGAGGGAGGGGGAVGGGGAGGGGCGAAGGIAIPHQRLRLDPSSMDKLHGDITVSLLRSWRNRWKDFS
jgi:hypothetical protein